MSQPDEPRVTGAAPHPPLEKYYRGEPQRRGFVTGLFDRTAPHYDWINGVMSLGSGVRYRRDALRRAGLAPGDRILDVAIGTGLVARAARDILGGGDARTLMEYFWDTVDNCVPPAAILAALAGSGFISPGQGVMRRVFSEYAATKPRN